MQEGTDHDEGALSLPSRRVGALTTTLGV
jgi:hypothetical protein